MGSIPPVYALDAKETDQVPKASYRAETLSFTIQQDKRCGTDYSSDNSLAEGAPLVRVFGVMQVPDECVGLARRLADQVPIRVAETKRIDLARVMNLDFLYWSVVGSVVNLDQRVNISCAKGKADLPE